MKKGLLQLPRAYLAGPMTGYEEHNFPAFEKWAAHLRQHGYVVVNPAELEALETEPRKEWAYYLKRDLRELLTCDHIAVMQNWQRSRGATLEVYVGWRLGFTIIEADTLAPIDVSGCNFSSIENETSSQAFVRAFTPPKMERAVPDYTWDGYADDPKINALPPGMADKLGEAYQEAAQKVYKEPRESILEEAQRIVGGDRAKAYGHPLTDFQRTALIWEAVLGIKVDPHQVALCMIGVKVSRECNARKRDNAVDIAGYAQTLSMVNDKLGSY